MHFHFKVAVEGHTDNMGARAFNMDLSQRRVQSVVDCLVKKGGLARSPDGEGVRTLSSHRR